MRILKSELRLRLPQRKPRPFSRAASADDARIGGDIGVADSAISSPSTPNSSLSSQSNLISTPSPNSPASATPAGTPAAAASQSAVTPTANHHQQSYNNNNNNCSTSGHKNSLKGTKLARRARSFKDDFFERIWLMRTPTNTLGRSHSPQSPRSKHAGGKAPPTAEEMAKSSRSLETHVKDISNALKHFRDVILKKKLEVLPGNGTVILETIASMFSVIQSHALNENSSVFLSAKQQVYQALGKLLRLCDDVMLTSDGTDCASLSKENVKEVVDLLEDAVKNLVALAQQKLKEKEESAFKYGPEAADVATPAATAAISHNHLMRPPIEVAGQRTSLPDITLTPKERDILEKTNSNPIRASHSTESILRDTSPPPKPPLPNNLERSSNPPPLPPKRRTQQQLQQLQHQHLSNNNSLNSDLGFSSDFSLMNCVVDYLSVRSRSPDENSSQCSLDSALNHSREEEDLKALGLEGRLEDNLLEDDVEKMFAYKTQEDAEHAKSIIVNKASGSGGSDGYGSGVVANAGAGGGSGSVLTSTAATVAAGIQNMAAATVLAVAACSSNKSGGGGASAVAATGGSAEKLELRQPANNNNRHSNESGFVSMQSFRTSTQSVSKRSSDYSVQSSTKSSSNSESAFGTGGGGGGSEIVSSESPQQQQRLTNSNNSSSSTTTTTATSFSTSSNTSVSAAGGAISKSVEEHLSSTKYYSATTTSSSASLSTAMSLTLASNSNNNININNHNSDDNHSISNTSSISPDHFMEHGEKVLSSKLHSMSSLTKTNSLDISSTDDVTMPPALPPKNHRSRDRHFSQFDIDEIDDASGLHELPELRHHPNHFAAQQHNHHLQQQQHYFHQWQSKHQSLIEPRHAASCMAGSLDGRLDEPPPLPVKKKYILAYMEVCSQSKHTNEQHRHTMHAYNLSRNISHSQTMNIVPMAKEFTSPEQETPPALPPKNYKQRKPTATPPTIITTPPPSPKPSAAGHADTEAGAMRYERVLGAAQGNELMSTVCEEFADLSADEQLNLQHSHHLPNEVDATARGAATASPNCQRLRKRDGSSGGARTPICMPDLANEEDEGIDVVLENHSFSNKKQNCAANSALSNDSLPNILEEVDVLPYIIFKKEQEDGPDVKGGFIDALIVHASGGKKGNAFSEAFITTFRTFIQPIDVIEKLAHRYTIFFCQMNDDQKQKAAKEAFSLLVRVVNDLTSTDLTNQLFALLGEFIYQVVCEGQLYLAKLLRQQYMEKVIQYKEQGTPNYLPELHATLNSAQQLSLLDLKSVEIAEQMTLLDAELFQKIEIPEVLLFAKEQCEEKSPNLNKFTEHFNKMSYWARSKILSLDDAKDREKHVIKFIKIMKHLRKMNNYNSYLALLSALDSAPIRRLEWHKTITEGLKEYCTLIDSSSSFRVYRQALAETNPPCIPYIGLVLQDLTFVHVGNPDYVKDGVINFSKRWQQHNIIVNMKRFKKCSYPFRKNERIIQFFGNFEKFLSEEEMWQISEHLKPRGKRPAHN